LVIPVNDSADFGNASPEELHREWQFRGDDSYGRRFHQRVRRMRQWIRGWLK
jgi:hypothetical protein